MDVHALAHELAPSIEDDVRLDEAHRAAYARDASDYREPPVGVVLPKTKKDVEVTIAAGRRRVVPVLGRGGGTSLTGQCCNVAVVLDFTRYMNRVLDVGPGKRLARVEPGSILDDLREQNVRGVVPLNLAEVVWMALGPDGTAGRPPRKAFGS